MKIEDVFAKLLTEHRRSNMKYPSWGTLDSVQHYDAIKEEFLEWSDAYLNGDEYGEHGEVAELYDLMNVCAKRIMELERKRNI